MPEDLVAEAFEQQRAFFSLPLQAKMQVAANKYYRQEGCTGRWRWAESPRHAAPVLGLSLRIVLLS